MPTYSRYRTRTPPLPRTFYGDRKGNVIGAGQKLGMLNEYQANGNLLQSTQLNATGSPKRSLAIERCWDEIHPGPPYRDGGNFAIVKMLVPSSGVVGSGTYTSKGNPAFAGKARVEYVGNFCFSSYNPGSISYEEYLGIGPDLPWAPQEFPSLGGYELQAWDRIRPRIEKASIPQFTYELRDLSRSFQTSCQGFKDLWHLSGGAEGKVYMLPGKAADHFLNHNFGWVPFVKDLMKFYEVWERSEDYIKDAMRRNGQWTKRKALVDQSFEDVRLYHDYVSLLMPGIGDSRIFQIQETPQHDIFSGQTEVRSRETKRVWAEGKFYQYRPEFDEKLLSKFPSDWSKTKQLLQLYGVRINPSTLYKITPWSWLIDWFVGIGRNIDIWSNSILDSVAAKYAYLMCHETKQIVMTTSLHFWSGTANFSRVYNLETKVRAEMQSPYGFNLGWQNLSAKQLAILTALGIKRRR